MSRVLGPCSTSSLHNKQEILVLLILGLFICTALKLYESFISSKGQKFSVYANNTSGYGLKEVDYDRDVENTTSDGYIHIRGGGKIPAEVTLAKRPKRKDTFPFDLKGLHLHPYLEIPADEDIYYRIWPLKLTNLNYTLLFSPTCPHQVFIVILVNSRSHDVKSRDLIRRTWGSFMRNETWPGTKSVLPNVRVYFVVGLQYGNDEGIMELQKEYTMHKDLIVGDFMDTYHNLTLKSLLGLTWMTRSCTSARYLLKVDDDIFVNIPEVLNVLNQLGYPNRSMIGYVVDGQAVRKVSNKWMVPKERFPFDEYPRYLPGAAYVISNDIIPRIVNAAAYVPPIHIDDVFITGILRRILGIKAITNPAFGVLDQRNMDPSKVLSGRKCVMLSVGGGWDCRLRIWEYFRQYYRAYYHSIPGRHILEPH